MVDGSTEEEFYFPFNRWLGKDKEDGQLHRESAVVSPGLSPVPGRKCYKKLLLNLYLCNSFLLACSLHVPFAFSVLLSVLFFWGGGPTSLVRN